MKKDIDKISIPWYGGHPPITGKDPMAITLVRVIIAITLTVLIVGGVTVSAARTTSRDGEARRLDPDALGLPEDWLADAGLKKGLSPPAGTM